MKLSILSSILLGCVHTALGLQINLGNTASDNVAWEEGDDPCENTYINPYGDNPCGIVFYVNGAGYAAKNCGSSPYELIPADGSSPLICQYENNYNKNCNGVTVYEVWSCIQ